jgi:RecA/RadA recombinase
MVKKKKDMEDKTNGLKESVKNRLAPKKERSHLYLSTSSPILDYYLANQFPGGFAMGKVANIIGDSSSGKSSFSLTLLAEASTDPLFDDYALILDDAEFASEFNIKKLFGPKLEKKLQPPKKTGASESVEELYQNLLTWLDKKDKPFIYIVDSLDSIKSKEDEERALQFKKKGTADGTYGTGKPKLMSEMLRVITGKVKKTNSFILVISQVRDKIGATFGSKIDRAGGKALTFYCSYILGLAYLSAITYDYSKTLTVNVGNKVLLKVTKNKLTGKKRQTHLHFYDEYGIDALTPTIDFLINTGHIKKDTRTEDGKVIWSKKYVFSDDLIVPKKQLISEIDGSSVYKDLLKEKVEAACKQIEVASKIDRKPKYGE